MEGAGHGRGWLQLVDGRSGTGGGRGSRSVAKSQLPSELSHSISYYSSFKHQVLKAAL